MTLLAAYLFAPPASDDHTDDLRATPSRHDVRARVTASREAQAERDRAVVLAVRDDDVHAFEAIFAEHYATLVAFATGYTHIQAIAEELVADAFATLWERRANWSIRTTIEAYLFGIVRHRLTDAWRIDRRRAELDNTYRIDTHVERAVIGPDEQLDAAELDARITRAIDALPQRYRDVVILRCRREMEYAEVAEALGISVAAVHQQMSRAIRMLRAALGVRDGVRDDGRSC